MVVVIPEAEGSSLLSASRAVGAEARMLEVERSEEEDFVDSRSAPPRETPLPLKA